MAIDFKVDKQKRQKVVHRHQVIDKTRIELVLDKQVKTEGKYSNNKFP